MRPIVLGLLCLGFSATLAHGSFNVVDGPVDAKVSEVTDGDTFVFTAHPWPEIVVGPYSLRVDGVDTPEIRGKCQSEKDHAQRAKAFTEALLNANGNWAKLTTIGCTGKGSGGFGRCRAHVNIAGTDLATALINSGNGRVNHGEARLSWCP